MDPGMGTGAPLKISGHPFKTFDPGQAHISEWHSLQALYGLHGELLDPVSTPAPGPNIPSN